MNEQMNIYRSFEQWKNGNVLEHGVPRIEYYSEAQLDLVEMGWNYGYDAGRAVEQALDKKADNARELGLSYDDEPKIGCVNHDCDKCKAVQEPWGYLEIDDIESQREYPHNCRNVNLWHKGGEGMVALYTTPPAAQPAVQEPVAQSLKDAVFTVIEGFNIPPDVRKILESAYYTTPPAAPVQEPVFCEYCGGNDDADFGLPTDHCTDCARPQPAAQKPWAGLTDEDIEQGHKESWVDKQAFESAVWWAEKKLKEKNT